MNKATVIIPTTGAGTLKTSIESVQSQSIQTDCYVIVDGAENAAKIYKLVDDLGNQYKIKFCFLPINVGANGFYGHRIYAAFTHLVNTEYVLYLDQDCWFENNHVETLINKIESTNSHWGYSLRKIVDKNGYYICNDDCESLGKWRPVMEYSHIDTNCYCIKTEVANKICNAWHGGWGQDRVFFKTLSTYFTNFVCSNEYSLNYRLAGNDGSVKKEFFEHWNGVVKKKFTNGYPWRNI